MRARTRALASLLAVVAIGASLTLTSSPAAAVDDWFHEYAGAAYNVTGTYTPIVGDFGGTEQDDIIWYAPGSGTESLWLSNGTGGWVKSRLTSQVNGTYIPITGDFGGDQRDDIFWYAPGAGQDWLWLTDSLSFVQKAKSVGGSYQPFVLADTDFGGPGRDDLAWYAPGAAADSLWVFAETGNHTSIPMAIAGSPKPLVGDYDGDDFADVFFYTPGSTPEELWRGNGNGGFIKSGFNVGGTYQPVVQQFSPPSGDTSDILWFRPGAPNDPLWQGNESGGFATSTQNVSGTGSPIGGIYQWGYLFTWSPTSPDRAWYLNEEGPAYDDTTKNTEMGAGYTPIVGLFENDNVGIFWYKPGTAPERLFL